MTGVARHRPPAGRALTAGALSVLVLLASCGADDGEPAGDDPPTPTTGADAGSDAGSSGTGTGSGSGSGSGPTVAPERFEGLFAVTELRVGGAAEQPLGPIVFEIDTEFGSLTIETDCGTLLGSFSFFDGGEAHVTVAGRSVASCGGAAEAQVGRLLFTLGAVGTWEDNGKGFDLVTPSGDVIALLG